MRTFEEILRDFGDLYISVSGEQLLMRELLMAMAAMDMGCGCACDHDFADEAGEENGGGGVMNARAD